MEQVNDAYEAYEKDYLKRRHDICIKLLRIKENCPDKIYSSWLLDAINFIQEEHR